MCTLVAIMICRGALPHAALVGTACNIAGGWTLSSCLLLRHLLTAVQLLQVNHTTAHLQGGSIAYAAAVATAYGVRACIVTAGGSDADLSAFQGHELHVFSTEQTLTFDHTYTWWGESSACQLAAEAHAMAPAAFKADALAAASGDLHSCCVMLRDADWDLQAVGPKGSMPKVKAMWPLPAVLDWLWALHLSHASCCNCKCALWCAGNNRKLRVTARPNVTLSMEHVPLHCRRARTALLGPLTPADLDAASFVDYQQGGHLSTAPLHDGRS